MESNDNFNENSYENNNNNDVILGFAEEVENGDLEIETSDNTITFNNIKANFMNDNNTFSVIIDEEYHD